ESGAIIEYLAESESGGALSIPPGEASRADYLYWLHFAEGSAMLPLLLKLYIGFVGEAGAPLMQARVEPEIEKYLGFADRALNGGDYFAGGRFTAADIQMSFVMDVAKSRAGLERFPNLMRTRVALQQRPAYQRALQKGGPYKFGA
ncbi:MAG: glutathione S-transferase family protein, partial [Hyphomonadaceae bacterium]